jgi:pimeloyl-ACP methyl ester carboxylesterase
MNLASVLVRILSLVLAVPLAVASAHATDFGPPFKVRSIPVDGGTISANVGGAGPVVVLLHGYGETSLMWKPIAARLASRFTVIAPDLPGIGDSSIPATGIDMKSSAQRIHAAVHALGHTHVRLVGHDIGLMVAYAYASTYPQEVEKLVLMDAFLPGVEGWRPIYDNPGIWHFRFYGPTPEALVKGRERVYFEHFWNDFAADARHSIPEAQRRAYTTAYARPGRMAAGFAYFKAFTQTATDFADMAKTPLPMPVLAIGGEKSLGDALGAQARVAASNVTVVVVRNAGHWIMEEQPAETMAALERFL